jgi:predicted Fe-Mo cluster-binding NifX family protein
MIDRQEVFLMNFRTAIATSDGIVVNQHFGHTDSFLIVDVDDEGQPHTVEQRRVQPLCDGGNHDEGRLAAAVEALSDCEYVLVSRIGPGASVALEQRGITVYEVPGVIEESLNKLFQWQSYRHA